MKYRCTAVKRIRHPWEIARRSASKVRPCVGPDGCTLCTCLVQRNRGSITGALWTLRDTLPREGLMNPQRRRGAIHVPLKSSNSGKQAARKPPAAIGRSGREKGEILAFRGKFGSSIFTCVKSVRDVLDEKCKDGP
ncbi:hypothetical protein KM043_004566 [Ampulex compressa]|nr:hypothetical protein KM043_004566 [Ampulex compressa]